MDFANSIAHRDVLALPGNLEPGLFQRPNRPLVIDPGDSRHLDGHRPDFLRFRVLHAVQIHLHLLKRHPKIIAFRHILRDAFL